MAAATTAVNILRPITAFLSEVHSQPDLRHRIISSARRKPPFPDQPTLQALALISQTLKDSSSNSKPSPSLLRSAEKLLLSLPRLSPLSSILLSLALSLRLRHVDAALALLALFALDPSAARNEIAPPVFEDLFIPHLLPAIQWFADQRSRILMSDPKGRILEEEDEDDGRSIEATAAMTVLSRMSGGQAEELRALEREYDDVLDENSRIYAEYLRKVLENSDGMREGLSPPQLVLTRINGEGGGFKELEEEVGRDEIGLSNGRYNNVMHIFLFSLLLFFFFLNFLLVLPRFFC